MRAAVYLRQSLDRNGDELAITRQRQDCLALCAARSWSPAEYVDNDVSASSGKTRPAYRRMLADAAAGRVGAVVCWDLDRLHRRPIELEEFIALADEKRLALATVTGEVDLSTDNGRLFARIKGAVARAEVERKAARQRRAAKQLAEAGRPWWRSRPFGFDADPDPVTGKWWTAKRTPVRYNPVRLHPVEAPLLRAAYRAVLTGTALGRVAADWNGRGVTTPGGKPWRGSSVRDLLLAARNAGLREHNGQVVGPGDWPAIVDEELWRGVRALLADPQRGGRAPRGRKRLLSGIALCGLCGRTLGGGRDNGRLTYTCKHCFGISRPAEPIDAMVTEVVVARLSRPDAIELTRRRDVAEADAEALRELRKSLRAQQVDAARRFADGENSYEFASAADRRLRARIEAIDAQLTDEARVHTFDGLIGEDVVTDQAFAALDLSRKRAVIAALLVVTVKSVGRGCRREATADIDIEFLGLA